MNIHRTARIYVSTITVTWLAVVGLLTLGTYSCAAFDRRETLMETEQRGPGHTPPAVTGPTLQNQVLQGGAAWKADTQGLRTRTATKGLISLSGLSFASSPDHSDKKSMDTGVAPGRHLEALESSGQLYEVTAYSHLCTLPRSGKDTHARRAANGRWPVADRTIAADPSIPFGSELLIEGLGFRTVGDRGSDIKGRRIDLFVDTCREALAFGRRWMRVYPVPRETTKEALWQ